MQASKLFVTKILRDYIMYIVLVILAVLFAFNSNNFFSAQNLINLVNQCAYQIVIGVGITFIMLSGALDLSIGYQMSVIAVVMGLLAGRGASTLEIVAVGIALGVALSTINGAIYARLKVFPFMITLATQYVFNGATYLLSGSRTFKGFDNSFKFIGAYKIGILGVNLPVGILFMIVIVCIGSFILNKTYFGRNIYALGSNPEAVALSGVSVAKMRILVFAIAGIFISIGTIMTVGRTGASTSGTGVGDEFTIMAGAMLGGIKMGGGGGRMNNMIVGMLIIQILNNGMDLMNLNPYWQKVAMGLILLIAITLDTLQSESFLKRAKRVQGNPPAGPENTQGESAGQ